MLFGCHSVKPGTWYACDGRDQGEENRRRDRELAKSRIREPREVAKGRDMPARARDRRIGEEGEYRVIVPCVSVCTGVVGELVEVAAKIRGVFA